MFINNFKSRRRTILDDLIFLFYFLLTLTVGITLAVDFVDWLLN